MRTRTALVAAPMLLLLAGCTTPQTPPPTDDESFVSASEAPVDESAATAPGPVEADTTLIVKATATSANGAALALEMRVHQPVPYDDVANQTLPGVLAEVCAGTLSQDIFAQQRWSFARANITAVLPSSTEPDSAGSSSSSSSSDWTAEARVGTLPSAEFVAVAARGFLMDDPAAPTTTPRCLTNKSFVGPGKGAFAIGIPGDTLEGYAPGSYTRWANHRFGFEVAGDSGITLSECTFEVTAVGAQFGGGTDTSGAAWASSASPTSCAIGASSEAKEY